MEALDTDLHWKRTHTRLLVRARAREQKGLDSSFLLQGKDLQDAEHWLANTGAANELTPTSLQTRYIFARRNAAVSFQRKVLGGVCIALAVAVVLSVVAIMQRRRRCSGFLDVLVSCCALFFCAHGSPGFLGSSRLPLTGSNRVDQSDLSHRHCFTNGDDRWIDSEGEVSSSFALGLNPRLLPGVKDQLPPAAHANRVHA